MSVTDLPTVNAALNASSAFFLALGWGSDAALSRRAGLLRLGAALGSVALGMLMGAIQFWPVKAYEPFSPRAGTTRRSRWPTSRTPRTR